MFAGTLAAIISTILFSLRSSWLKDLGSKEISKSQINFYYRLISLPIIILIFLITRSSLEAIQNRFYMVFIISIFTNIILGIFQVYIYKKHKFSEVESLYFFIILLNLLTGYLFFGEIISQTKLFGVFIVLFAFMSLFVASKRKGEKLNYFYEIFLYYCSMSLVDIFNKKSIVYSSPLAYTLLMSVSLAVFNLFLSIRIKKPDFGIYLLKDRKTNFYLLMVGLFASATTILLPFAYKLLPLGILTTIASLRVFISLWISHKKYFEDGLKIKLIATAVALLGTIIVVAG